MYDGWDCMMLLRGSARLPINGILEIEFVVYAAISFTPQFESWISGYERLCA